MKIPSLSELIKLIERIGVPTVICGALIWIIVVGFDRLERSIEKQETAITALASKIDSGNERVVRAIYRRVRPLEKDHR